MRRLLALLLFCIALSASAAEFTVLRPQQSSVAFVSKQMGVPVLDINGKIIVGFDPDAIEKALKKK